MLLLLLRAREGRRAIQGALLMSRGRGASEKHRKYRAVVRRDGNLCAQCKAIDDLTLDHIVPRSRGGAGAIANLQILCRSCNHAKGNSLTPGLVTRERLRPRARDSALALKCA